MAKVDAPLLSFNARGTIGGVQTYASWRGVRYARRRVIPANPRTTEQQKTRNTFSTLSAMWKVSGPLLREPWEAFATGQSLTARNAFIGHNTRVLRPATSMAQFIGSPGARGGLPPDAVTAQPTMTTGELQVTVTPPAPPTGWTLEAVVAVAFPDQSPTEPFGGPIVEAESAGPTPEPITFSGLQSGMLYVVSAWTRWRRPDNMVAYGASLTVTATPA